MNLFNMHMADGLVSLNIGLVFLIISFIMIGVSIKKINEEHDDRKIPLMGVMGAFVFAAQMINFTIPGTGSSGHIGGGILLCLVLGQYPAFLSLCSVLIIQCLFFGDGGMLALGCNMFNMGVIPCFLVYPIITKTLLKNKITTPKLFMASVLSVVIALELGAFAVVLQTLLSHITQLPFTSFISLMLPIHLAIGIVEGLITFAVVGYVLKDNPAIIDNSINNKSLQTLNIKKQVLVLLILTILVGGGLSLYASSNPDGLEWSIEGVTGSSEISASGTTKDTLAKIQEKTALLPDYNFSDSDSNFGVSFSGIIGGAATLMLIGAIGYIAVKKKKYE